MALIEKKVFATYFATEDNSRLCKWLVINYILICDIDCLKTDKTQQVKVVAT